MPRKIEYTVTLCVEGVEDERRVVKALNRAVDVNALPLVAPDEFVRTEWKSKWVKGS